MDGMDQIVALLQHAGPYGPLVLTIWWLRMEREERIASQARERALSERMLTSMTRTTNAIRSLRFVLLHGKAPTPDEYEAEDVQLDA